MNIVIGSSYLWRDCAKVGLHAFGEYFITKGCRVEWFTIPFSLFHLVKPTKLAIKWQRLAIALGHPVLVNDGGSVLINRVLFTIVHPVNLPFFNSYFVSRSYLRWTFPPLQRVLRCDGVYPVDLLFFDSGGLNIYYPLHSMAKVVIYRLNDLVAEFPGQVRGRVESEREILRKVDLVLAVSESLYEEAVRIRGTSKGVHLLPNGVNIEPFSKPWPEPADYKQIPSPRAIFVGSLSTWFDWELLKEVATIRPSISFVLIGRGTAPVRLPKNVYLLGPRPHAEVPGYLLYADVGLILFKDLPRIARTEKPLKFYEYLAAGLPIVSVPYGNLKRMEPYALFGSDPIEFAEALDEAIKIGANQEERNWRKAEASKFSWDNVFAQFDRILREEGLSI